MQAALVGERGGWRSETMNVDALIAQVAEVTPARPGGGDVEITDIVFDSRHVRPGALFVALDGAHADGHAFVARAVDAGASAVLVNQSRAAEFDLPCPILQAADTRQALGTLAAAFFGHPSDALCMVGVTGTNGKTTITWILEAMFAAAGGAQSSGLLGTIEYRWGSRREPAANTTPESLVTQRLLRRMHEDGVRRVAMEVSSHGLSTHRLRGTHFDAAIFSNLTQDHLDFHGTMDAYRAAKARFFEELVPEARAAGKDAIAIINLDDPNGAWFAERARLAGAPVQTFAVNAAADWRAEQITVSLEETAFRVRGPQDDFVLRSHLIGDFNISNVLAACVAARHVGISPAQIQQGLDALRSVPGRLQRVGLPGADGPRAASSLPGVFVDYAHTPDALMRALQTIRPVTRGRLWVVFGCGGDRDRDKRPQMGELAARLADICVVTSDNPRSEPPQAIVDAILTGVDTVPGVVRLDESQLPVAPSGVWVQPDRAAAIATALGAARADDVVLIAGKGHETYQEINGVRVNFDDTQHARQALELRAPHSLRVASWSLAKIAHAMGGALRYADSSKLVETAAAQRMPTGVCTDTRKLRPGELFVALRGDNFDAHDLLGAAGDALALVVERVQRAPSDRLLIVVDDTLQALTRLGHALWCEARDAGVRTINITGSNGKTTVKEMVAALWSEHGQVFATPGNLNNHIGVPLTLCAMPMGCETLVLEMGASAVGEISQLIALAPGEVRIITSIGMAHLEGFGSLENIRRAKSEIFERADAQTRAIVPFEEAANLIGADFQGQVTTIGDAPPADLWVEPETLSDGAPDNAAQALRVRRGDGAHPDLLGAPIYLPLPGAHNARNAAVAIATLQVRGESPQAGALNASFAGLTLPAGRWRRVQVGDFHFIDDAYNANPSSLRSAARAFLQTPLAGDHTRVIVVGEMRELGPTAQQIHRDSVADLVRTGGFDAILAVGTFAPEMRDEGLSTLDAMTAKGAQKHTEIAAVEDAAAAAAWLLEYGAHHRPPFVLLKASRGARLERIIDLFEAQI